MKLTEENITFYEVGFILSGIAFTFLHFFGTNIFFVFGWVLVILIMLIRRLI